VYAWDGLERAALETGVCAMGGCLQLALNIKAASGVPHWLSAAR
jgi:hypothetical protein